MQICKHLEYEVVKRVHMFAVSTGLHVHHLALHRIATCTYTHKPLANHYSVITNGALNV